jgi:hypothetical protein
LGGDVCPEGWWERGYHALSLLDKAGINEVGEEVCVSQALCDIEDVSDGVGGAMLDEAMEELGAVKFCVSRVSDQGGGLAEDRVLTFS